MEELNSRLASHGQQHLTRFWHQLTDKEREMLIQDIRSFDLAEVCDCFQRATQSLQATSELLDEKIQPVPDDYVASATTCSKEELEKFEELGLKEIADGKVAVLLMAGGQGTRLGVDYPKGMFDVGLPSGSSLFKLQAKRIRKLEQLANDRFGKRGKIQWYIMTSDATEEHTLSYFIDNDYFGLNEANIKTFRQNMLPCFDFDGKMILDEKHRVSQAPDGNGGLYKALKNEGILEDMQKRGIRSVHVFSVDNILVKVADPLFVGYCLSRSADTGVKTVIKSCPTEAVGVVCKVDGHYRVVEYSEIKSETAELRRDDGNLVFDAGNICNHYFTVDFLQKVVNQFEGQLDLHVAKKKIPYVNDEGTRIVPKTPNGIKIEKFIFDVFKFTHNLVVWQVDRKNEFSPLKNANAAGVDCALTAKSDILALHKKWLLAAGAKSVEGEVEVDPLLSYGGENLAEKVKDKVLEGPLTLF